MKFLKCFIFTAILVAFVCVLILSVNAQTGNQPTQPPTISSFTPARVNRGKTIQVFGTNLGEDIQFFGPAPAASSAANTRGMLTEDRTNLIVEVPANLAPGEYTLSVSNSAGAGTSTQILKVRDGSFPPASSGVYDEQKYTPPTTLGEMIQLIYNYSFQVVGLIIFIMFVLAGFMWLAAGGNPGTIGKARSRMTSAILGGVLLMSSWLILNTINPDLVNVQFGLPGVEVPPGPVPPTAVGTGGNIQRAAQELLTLIGPNSFDNSADCGSNFHARQNIQDIAAGRFPAVCSFDCRSRQPVEQRCPAGGPNGNINVNPAIFEGLAKLWRDRSLRFKVTSLTTGAHSKTSSHYGGNGVDIVPVDRSPTVWQEARNALNSYGGKAICETVVNGQAVDDRYCNLSRVNHIHWTR